MKKIVLLMPLASQSGGAEKLFIQYVLNNPLNGNFVVVFFEDGPLVSLSKSNKIITEVVESGRLSNIFSFFSATRKIVKLIKKYHSDLIFSWMNKAHFYGFAAGVASQTPAIWFQWNKPDKTWPQDVWLNFLPTEMILTCSKANVDLQKKYSLNGTKIELAYPGIDLEKFKSQPNAIGLKQKLQVPDDRPIISFFGRLQEWKGAHVFLEAAKIVLKKIPNTYFLLIGGQHPFEKPYLKKLEDIIKQNDLGKSIKLAGHQTNVEEWMQISDICIHASNYEPFGLVVIESMSLAKPTIAGRGGGPSEIVRNDSEGILLDYGDSQNMANKIIFLLENPIIAKKIGLNGQKRSQDFRIENFIISINEKIFN